MTIPHTRNDTNGSESEMTTASADKDVITAWSLSLGTVITAELNSSYTPANKNWTPAIHPYGHGYPFKAYHVRDLQDIQPYAGNQALPVKYFKWQFSTSHNLLLEVQRNPFPPPTRVPWVKLWPRLGTM